MIKNDIIKLGTRDTNRGAFNREKYRRVFDRGPRIHFPVEREKVDLVWMQSPPVFGSADNATVEQDAAVCRVHTFHVTVQIILKKKKLKIEHVQ